MTTSTLVENTAATLHEDVGAMRPRDYLLLVLLCGYASYGHIANDFSDRAADRATGKHQVLAMLPENRARAVVWAAVPVAIAVTLWFWPKKDETARNAKAEVQP